MLSLSYGFLITKELIFGLQILDLKDYFSASLSYFVILRYKLPAVIKIYDDFVNDPINGDFQKTLLHFHIGRKSFVKYKWLWLHTTRKTRFIFCDR